MKTCTVCNAQKLFAEFHKDSSRKDGYRSLCKECVSSHSKTYYQKNKKRIIDNYSAWVEKNRTQHNLRCQEWVKRNQGKVNERTARRYAAKTSATPKWLTTDDKWVIVEAYELAQLRSKLFGVQWEVDHIVPLRGRGVMGLHVPWNLRVVPMQQNRRKSNILSAT
jgi:hypothetical protein